MGIKQWGGIINRRLFKGDAFVFADGKVRKHLAGGWDAAGDLIDMMSELVPNYSLKTYMSSNVLEPNPDHMTAYGENRDVCIFWCIFNLCAKCVETAARKNIRLRPD